MDQLTEEIVPTKFELAQNYPNPFKEKTIIKYCLPDRMKIKLEVFNSNNKKVKTLIDGTKEAGTYKLEFISNELNDGEYIYKLETENYFDSKKMTVIK